MPQVSTQEFERLPLRVHAFLAGVPLHDVWAVDLPRTRPGITLDQFLQAEGARPDRSKSLVPAGTREGLFRVVYRFENEQLLEVINRTAHAAALSVLVKTANTYRFYFGVYVRNVGRFTPVYMAMIDPFRKLIVYPSLLRSVRASWKQAFGAR